MPGKAPHRAGRARPAAWRRALVLLAALVVALLLGEVAVRLVRPQDLTGSFRVQSPGRGQLINRASGRAQHQLGDRIVEYRFDGRHLRGSAASPDGAPVLLLGDSFTFGVLLDEPDTYASQLGQRADAAFGKDRVEILNGGVSGFGLANMVALLEEYGDSLRPELVVVFFNGGDIQRSVDAGLYTLDEHGELQAHDLPPRRLKSFVNAIPGYAWLLEHSHLLQLARRVMVPKPTRAPDEGPPAAPEPDTAADLGRALFVRLHAWCDARDIELLVLTTGYQDSPHFGSQRYPSQRFLEQAPAFFREQGIEFHDLAPALLRQSDGDWDAISIAGDGHPNERGARVVAELAWPRLEPLLRRMVESR
ncbi:MAG: GDSL-type esterase/lipase family protein [Myxococcota bacterium]